MRASCRSLTLVVTAAAGRGRALPRIEAMVAARYEGLTNVSLDSGALAEM